MTHDESLILDETYMNKVRLENIEKAKYSKIF